MRRRTKRFPMLGEQIAEDGCAHCSKRAAIGRNLHRPALAAVRLGPGPHPHAHPGRCGRMQLADGHQHGGQITERVIEHRLGLTPGPSAPHAARSVRPAYR